MTKKFIFKLRYVLNDELDDVAIILAKDIPTYSQVGNLVEIPLTEKHFNKYYDRFKFVVDKLYGKKDVVLFHENIEVNAKFLQEFYVAINELKREDRSKRKNSKTHKPAIPTPPLNITTKGNKLTENKPEKNKYGGIDSIVKNIKNTIELPIKTPELLNNLGVTPHKGILIYGESGCGKTLVANILKEQIGINFIEVKPYTLIEKRNQLNLLDILKDAIEKSPSIIYIDGIDAIATSRDLNNKNNNLLIDLLSLFDNISPTDRVTVLASTNRIDLIDPALIRSGRFDLKIKMERPSEEKCSDIFSKLTESMPIHSSFNKNEFSKKLVGLTGADIEFICREAAYNCIKRNIDLEIPLSVASANSNNKLLIKKEDFDLALSSIQ